MKSFHEFLEDLQHQIAQQGDDPLSKASGSGDSPPTGENPFEIIQEVGQDIRNVIRQKLLPILEKNQEIKQAAFSMLSGIVSEVSQQLKIRDQGAEPTQGIQGIQTNSEPMTPPKQPQAR